MASAEGPPAPPPATTPTAPSGLGSKVPSTRPGGLGLSLTTALSLWGQPSGQTFLAAAKPPFQAVPPWVQPRMVERTVYRPT